MVKELCNRCSKPVYPTDKVGPLKDSAYFHHGCFKCYICGTRLALKTYCNNRNNIDDKEVYCNNHVPNANPHDMPIFKKFSTSSHGENNAHYFVNYLENDNKSNKNNKIIDSEIKNKKSDAGLHDLKIAHAMKATQVAKPYPKIKHEGAKYIVDYDAQTRLELIHRNDEDKLYKEFSEAREKELNKFERETKEEWEKALTEFARRYEQGQANRHQKDDLIRQLTLKRDKKLETINSKRKERERHKTAELVDKQAKEMLELFRQARTEKKNHYSPNFKDENQNVYNAFVNGKDNKNSQLYNNNNQTHFYSGEEVDYEEENWSATSTSYPTTPPPPLPPSCSKRHVYTDTSVFSEIDQIAVNVAQSEVTTFTELIRTLTAGARSDVDKARAIFKWITVKNLNVMVFDNNLEKDSPMSLLRGIKNGTESYHVLFKRLCSYAGLHCVVIKGYSKSAGYQPGISFDNSFRFRNTWNAVFLDGSWRFVQCNWGARHLVNAKENSSRSNKMHNNYYSDFDFNSSIDYNNGKDGNLRYEYDDHYFMTDPEEFIYEFYPQQSEWQLLPRPITLRQFENLPFVRSLFFRYKLRFTNSKLPAVLQTDKSGAATISITSSNFENGIGAPYSFISSSSGYDDYCKDFETAPDNYNGNYGAVSFDNLIFHYNLRFYDSHENEVNGLNLKRFVMQSVINDSQSTMAKNQPAVVFRVHAPSVKPLLLDIFCNSVSADYYLTGQPIKFKSICKFKIVCESLNVIMVPLPECGSGEWGPAKALRLFGLIPLSHPDAIINCEQYCEIRFRMLKPLAEFIVTMQKNRCESRHLQRCCRTTIQDDQVIINLEFPDEGQYGLDIYTRDPSQQTLNAKQLLTHCCKYLINARVE